MKKRGKNFNIIYQAQALDNISKDYIQENDSLLSPDELEARRRCVSAISNVTKKGKESVFRDHLTIYKLKNSYVLYFPTSMKDIEGRTSIIACLFSLNKSEDKDVLDQQIIRLCGSLQNFTDKIGWEIEKTTLQRACDELLRVASKKNCLQKWKNILVSMIYKVLFISKIASKKYYRKGD